ncbi:MAG: hypothetical protein RR255_00035 [Bacilli bacterium]
MMKISIDGKELTGIIEKVSCNMKKEGYLSKILLVDDGNNLQASVLKSAEAYLEIYTDNYVSHLNRADLKLDKILLDFADLKLLTSMKNEVIIEETEENILVQNNGKTIKLIKYDTLEFADFSFALANDNTLMLEFNESEFQEIISNFSKFTGNGKNNDTMSSIHFNINDNRIEALDGHRLITRCLKVKEKITENGKIQIDARIKNDLGKVLDKKSIGVIQIIDGGKIVRVIGDGFRYNQRKREKDFFKVNPMLSDDYNYAFNVDAKKMLEHIKYYTDNVIDKKKHFTPVLFNISSDNITTYIENTRVKVSDKLKITNFKGKEKDLIITFNTWSMLDALKIADGEEIYCTATSPTAPLMIYSSSYAFLILPIKVKDELKAQLQEILDNEK